MKKSAFYMLIVFCSTLISIEIQAQIPEENKGNHFFGTSIGIGFISPKKVNERIEDYYGGEANIHLALNIEVNAGYYVTEEIEVKGALIAAAAFSQVEDKDMIGMANNKANFLTRISPEVTGNYHFKKNHYNSFYVGGGFSYNSLGLFIDSDEKTSSGKTPGLHINIGMLTQKKAHQTYLELKANLIKDSYLNFSGISLNYGIRF